MISRSDLDKTQSTRRAAVITPNNTTVFPEPTRGIYVGSTGTIRVRHADDSGTTDYPVLVAGAIYPWSVVQVHATGTTATPIIGQW
jgi:hypothetical protein